MFLSGAGPQALTLDATRLTFASPLDLAGIVATAHWAAADSIRVTLRLPADPAVTAYLQRMNVLALMPERTAILGRVAQDARTEQQRLIEVTALNGTTVNDLARRVGRLATSFSASSAAGAAVCRACTELLSNATEHGSSERGAFIAAQGYTGATTGTPRLEFAVCDSGVGVKAHLQQNPRYDYLTEDADAIAHALRAGVSGTVAHSRGHGLSDAITDSRHHGRLDFRIRSGKGEVRVTGTAASRRATRHTRADGTGGTWAWLTHSDAP